MRVFPRDVTGVYLIRCYRGMKVYVGSSLDIGRRWDKHRYTLRKGKHPCRLLQRDWNRYGEGAFEFEVVYNLEMHYRDKARLALVGLEQRFIDRYRASDPKYGYNVLSKAYVQRRIARMSN